MTDPSGAAPRHDETSPATPLPLVANTGAALAVGMDLRDDLEVPARQVRSWALWDWATQPFNSVILTFIFTALYLTTDVFL